MYPQEKRMKYVAAAFACIMAGAALLSQGGVSAAATSIQAPDCAHGDPKCFKEIRIVNNLPTTMYAVVQASIITQPALNSENGPCPRTDVMPSGRHALQQ